MFFCANYREFVFALITEIVNQSGIVLTYMWFIWIRKTTQVYFVELLSPCLVSVLIRQTYCYVCGEFTPKSQSTSISPIVKKAYELYFGCKVADQDKSLAPNLCCSRCSRYLRGWLIGSYQSMPFAVPMVWREQKDHLTDWYFCLTLTLLTWRIWWVPSSVSNFNVYYFVSYVWQCWQPSLCCLHNVSTLNQSWKASCIIFVCKHLVTKETLNSHECMS